MANDEPAREQTINRPSDERDDAARRDDDEESFRKR